MLNMNRVYAPAGILMLVILSLFSAGNLIAADRQLVFNVTGQPPLNNDQQTGFMDEVTREALRRIGYQLVINRQPAERGLHSVNDGLLDAEMSRIKGIDSTYKNLVRVPEKIMDWEFVLFSNTPVKVDNGWGDLARKKLAFINGWKVLESNVPESAFVTRARDSEQLFALLQNKRVDHVIYERWGGLKLLRDFDLRNVAMAKPPLAVREMFIYLNNRHQHLAPKLAEALSKMKADGTYKMLVDRHLEALK